MAAFLPRKPELALPGRNIRPLRLSVILENTKPVFFKTVSDVKVGKTEELSQIQNTRET